MTEPKDERLVTVATHLHVVDAAILQSRLEAEGIESYLIDGNLADVAWYLANAVGGAKLQVRAADAERAIRVAETQPEVDHSQDIDWPVPSPRALLLDKAIKVGALGVLFLPLQFYSLSHISHMG